LRLRYPHAEREKKRVAGWIPCRGADAEKARSLVLTLEESAATSDDICIRIWTCILRKYMDEVLITPNTQIPRYGEVHLVPN
jgi:hypothetical protein